MAQTIRLLNRPAVTLEEPKSGLDTFLEEVSKYASPEYQLRKKESEARIRYQDQQAQRENAKVRLMENEAVQNEEWRSLQIENAKEEEKRKKAKFQQDSKMKKDQEYMDDWSIIYPESSWGSEEGIATARGWLDNNADIDTSTYNALRTQLDQHSNALNEKNERLDSLGKQISIMNPDFNYDGSKSMRNLVEKQGDFFIKNLISQRYLGSMSPEMQVRYKQDMDDLSNLVKYGFEYSTNDEARNQFFKTTLAPAYENIKEQYGESVGSPAIEGLLNTAGYDFPTEEDDILKGKDKIEVIGDMDTGDVGDLGIGFLDKLLPWDTKSEKAVKETKPYEARNLKKSLDRLVKFESNRPYAMAGESVPQTRKEEKYQAQKKSLMNLLSGIKVPGFEGNIEFDPFTQQFSDPKFQKAFDKMVGGEKERYYSILKSLFPDPYREEALVKFEDEPFWLRPNVRNPFE